MEAVFEAVNGVFSFITPVSDFLWDFPTNFAWYANIPILGNFSLAIILLVGTGIFFTFRFGFIQVTHFRTAIRAMLENRSSTDGISPFAAFCLSSAMRVGPGNILGVTGAIAAGGPGALFWMWISAFFGMATAYAESVLAQIFKEKKDDELVGGLPYYGKRLLGDKQVAGAALSVLFILYALCCLPAQGFNAVDSIGQVAEIVIGHEIATTSAFYYVIAAVLLAATAFIAFGGIKKVTKLTDKMVPVMAVIYCGTVITLIAINFKSIPFFFSEVFSGAYSRCNFRRRIRHCAGSGRKARPDVQRGRPGHHHNGGCSLQCQTPLRPGLHSGSRRFPRYHRHLHDDRFRDRYVGPLAGRRRRGMDGP